MRRGVRGTFGVSAASLAVLAGAGPASALFVLAGAGPASADATVFAPSSVPGRTTVIDVWCGARATSASVNVTPVGGPPELPLEPYPAGGPGAFRASYLIPADAAPGRYALQARCDDGLAGGATLMVDFPAAAQPAGSDEGGNALALVTSFGTLVAVAGAGFAAVRRFGPRSGLHT